MGNITKYLCAGGNHDVGEEGTITETKQVKR